MKLRDKIGIGGTLEQPDVILPAHVGHQQHVEGQFNEMVVSQLQVIVKPHPEIKPHAKLHWDGKTYTISPDMMKRRRYDRTHHITLTLEEVN